MVKSLLPDEVKVNFTIDDNRIKSNLINNKTIRFTKRIVFLSTKGFTQSHSGPLGDIEGFIPLIPGSYKTDKPVNNTGVDKIHLKCDCVNGCIVNGTRELKLYSFALDQPPGYKIFRKA